MNNDRKSGQPRKAPTEVVRLLGPDQAALNAFDDLFREFAAALSAEELYLPSVIRTEDLEKCGYIRSFPQNLMAVSVIPEKSYAAVASGASVAGESLDQTGLFLAPAACLNVYPLYANDGNLRRKIVTTRSRVFRYEGGKWDGATRLCDFTMREIIVFGDDAFVKETLRSLEEKTLALARSLSPEAKLANAADPFFPVKDNVIKAKIQQGNALKSELIVPIEGKPVAIASFNRHGDHFTKPFGIGPTGEVVSGCAGFGLERWLAARRAQK